MRLVALLSFAALAACGQAVPPRDAEQAQECPPIKFDTAELNRPIQLDVMAAAPLVVVGVVRLVRAGGQVVQVPGFPQLKAQCTEITAEVENALRGEFRGRDVRFYYYVLSELSSADLGPPKYLPAIGQRRFFFLTSERGVVRSLGDVRDYTLRVDSGKHSDSMLYSLPFGQKAAMILLTPGSEYEPRRFANSLDEAAFVSDALTSHEETDGLLRKLSAAGDSEVGQTVDQLLADRRWKRRGR